jgi:hypothetical protein
MTFTSRKKTLLFLPGLILVLLATQGVATAPPPPQNPVLYLMNTEFFQQGGKDFIRYNYGVFNFSAYPDALFAAAPALPPCGKNAKASRTWVDIYDQSGKRIQGFCAFSKASDLNKIWFALEESVIPPSWVYIELNDRQTNTKYKSNLADTTL